MTIPNLGTGVPVELGQIDREIKKLWEQSGNVATRASLINLAVYCEGREAMERNTRLIGQIAQNHACRALLIVVEPEAKERSVQAWISAHCHIGRAGAKQTCCEQITFLLGGPSHNLIPNIVFSHLDSDLPLFLWWQGEFPDPIDSQLWTWVDRLIFDSNEWRDQCAELRQLRASMAEAQGRITLCDLNWTRTLYFRQALSLTFDHPDNLPFLGKIAEVSITHAPEYRSTAQLLVSWLAAQLTWQQPATSADRAEFIAKDGGKIPVRFVEAEGAPLSRLVLDCGEGDTITLLREKGSDFLRAECAFTDGRLSHSLFPAGSDTADGLINEELQRGGRHRVYLKALAIAEELF